MGQFRPTHISYERRPWYKPADDVMSVNEIRYWLKEIPEKHGWRQHAFARALGTKYSEILKKVSGKSWIYRTEHLRYSRVLKRIISGELICDPGTPRKRKIVIIPRIPPHAVVATNPRPLPQPVRSTFDFATGKLAHIYPRREKESPIPSFQTALKNAGRWRECTFPVEERRERDT